MKREGSNDSHQPETTAHWLSDSDSSDDSDHEKDLADEIFSPETVALLMQ